MLQFNKDNVMNFIAVFGKSLMMSAVAVDGWDFKQYVLGALFYRFISENFANYIEGGDESVDYAAFNDDDPIIMQTLKKTP